MYALLYLHCKERQGSYLYPAGNNQEEIRGSISQMNFAYVPETLRGCDIGKMNPRIEGFPL